MISQAVLQEWYPVGMASLVGAGRKMQLLGMPLKLGAGGVTARLGLSRHPGTRPVHHSAGE